MYTVQYHNADIARVTCTINLQSQSWFHLRRTFHFLWPNICSFKILLFSYSWTSLYPPILWFQWCWKDCCWLRCLGSPSTDGLSPVTIHFSRAAQACDYHGVEKAVVVLHWQRHQWVASTAGIFRPTARRTHWTLFLNESVQLYVFYTVYLFADTFHGAVFLGHLVLDHMIRTISTQQATF